MEIYENLFLFSKSNKFVKNTKKEEYSHIWRIYRQHMVNGD